MQRARLAADIGGTFTDVVLEHAGRRHSAKVLTTSRAPEEGMLAGIAQVLENAGCWAADIGVLIHGTTLATNALIERKGEDRPAHHRGLSRRARDGIREALRALRPGARAAGAAGAARAALCGGGEDHGEG
jgi:N-methylhydantoinase A/oxoprolinase/acetone carboxylase beta subunit